MNAGADRDGEGNPLPRGRLYSVAPFSNLTGAPISALNHAALLRRHFASVCLVVPGPGELISRANAAGLPLLLLPVENRGLRQRFFRRTLGRDLRAVLGSRWNYFRTLCREFRRAPGVVHIHETLSIAPLALLAARWCGTPSVLHVRYPARTGRERRRVRILGALARRVVCVSDGVRRGHGKWIQRQAKVIHNFMDLPPPLPVSTRHPPRIAMVSQMSPAKGTDLFMQACVQLRAQGLEFSAWMVGKWPAEEQRNRAVEFLREHGLTGCVELRDQASDMSAIYGEMDVLVLPTRRDAFPRVVMEAMCHGIPVVATRIDGVPEMVADGETGFLVAPDDAAGFAEATANLLRDDGLRHRMGAAGRERARQVFSPAAYESAMLALYREIGGCP